jgi:hypothetical protein
VQDLLLAPQVGPEGPNVQRFTGLM